MKEYKYVRLENINNYNGWEIEYILPAKSVDYVDMVVMSKHVEDPKSKKIEELKEKLEGERKKHEQEKKEILHVVCKTNNQILDYIEKELGNINIQENIMAKNELLVIKGILQGVIKGD